VRNIEQIMDVDGIDVAVIGHTDLSLSLGVPLQLHHPDFVAAVDAVLAACRGRGKTAGCVVADAEQGRQWIAKGFRMVAYSGDIWLLGGALKAGIERLRA
jgi:2-dehydro-3-deoxyglucarate aldolase/4-hydroxy-2-oxoheptanedioate aldolase